mmetsp:Transcript_3368/g.11044  ORF Transcript_3368/g.11044 Transcript_3368/m.11044 type:complete len:202 (+) Transcript_3368:1473-2078(+)
MVSLRRKRLPPVRGLAMPLDPLPLSARTRGDARTIGSTPPDKASPVISFTTGMVGTLSFTTTSFAAGSVAPASVAPASSLTDSVLTTSSLTTSSLTTAVLLTTGGGGVAGLPQPAQNLSVGLRPVPHCVQKEGGGVGEADEAEREEALVVLGRGEDEAGTDGDDLLTLTVGVGVSLSRAARSFSAARLARRTKSGVLLPLA